MPQDGEERFEARERLVEEFRQLLRERNLLLQRIHRMAADTKLPVHSRLSAIALWTEPWGRLTRMADVKQEHTK